jgi:microcystin-dependent protein
VAITPNMNLNLPDPTVTAGPEWATELNAAVTTVDEHDHTPGKGVLVPSTGLNINTDLSFQENSATEVLSANFHPQSSTMGASFTDRVYDVNGDLWWNNNSGTPVQVTAGNSIASASSPLVPSGVIWPYGGNSAPSGFLLCDGAAVSRTTYSALFAVVGTTNGPGDGSTTFNLPDLRGRVVVGAGTYTDPVSGSITRTMGDVLGAEKHQLISAELASHTHTDSGHTHTNAYQGNVANGGGFTAAGNNNPPFSGGGANVPIASGTANIQNTGGDTAHNNMQPSNVQNYIIKT